MCPVRSCKVLQALTISCRVLEDPSKFCKHLKAYIRSCKVQQDPARSYKNFQGPARSCKVLQFPEISCKVLQGPTRSFKVLQGSARMIKWYLYDLRLLHLILGCRTSKTDSGPIGRGALDQPCHFPFILRGKTYYTCTYDYSKSLGFKPWCSVNTDEKGNHVSGKRTNGTKTIGICDDFEHCPIPTRRTYLT